MSDLKAKLMGIWSPSLKKWHTVHMGSGVPTADWTENPNRANSYRLDRAEEIAACNASVRSLQAHGYADVLPRPLFPPTPAVAPGAGVHPQPRTRPAQAGMATVLDLERLPVPPIESQGDLHARLDDCRDALLKAAAAWNVQIEGPSFAVLLSAASAYRGAHAALEAAHRLKLEQIAEQPSLEDLD
jgi:hypothetical protein